MQSSKPPVRGDQDSSADLRMTDAVSMPKIPSVLGVLGVLGG
jgi:hypothetical protein